MKLPALVAFLVLWLCAGCGKVGDPRPPSIRVPAGIADLKVQQDQHTIVLTWTNPARYGDGSRATDLSAVRILRNGNMVFSGKVGGPGMEQTQSLDVSDLVGTTAVYTIEIDTLRNKVSAPSNPVSISIVETPGIISKPQGIMDQHKILLDWQPPDVGPSFANVYFVQRTDGAFAPQQVNGTHFEDTAVEEGKDKTYSYIVTAARGGTPPVPGPPSSPIVVRAEDTTKPAVPTGLQTPVVAGNGAILRWDLNTEADWAGYWVWRSDNPNTGFTKLNSVILTTTSFTDEGYRPGFYYAVSAVDMDGNPSQMSPPVSVP